MAIWLRRGQERAHRAWKRDLFVAIAVGVANRERVGWWARTVVDGQLLWVGWEDVN